MNQAWQALRVAITHHEDAAEQPAYADRFDAVLPFHAPGLAPVRRNGEAWHIHADGSPAYSARFVQTFGFYEGRAAVEARDGWHHILPTGEAVGSDRYAWCGNVQGGRVPVRLRDGRYVHLTADGARVSPHSWRYAGDYREGCAVVQRDDGLHSHVDPDGALRHDRWFLDLDVPHKGLARARDGAGWTHVDLQGTPVSPRRFAMVEPFYNGQARVERHDGGLEVINTAGDTLVELRPARVSPLHALSADLVGYWRTGALATAVELGLPEALPGSTAVIAARCGLSPDAAARLLRALWELGVVSFVNEGWTATARGEILRRDHPCSLADAALEYAGPLQEAWRALPDRLRGAPATEPFRAIAQDPDRCAAHHRMLAAYAAEDYARWIDRLPIPPGASVLDAGGGTGWLARRLAVHRPDLTITLLDLPEVVALAPPDLRAVGGDLFTPWQATADVILLARVLHDWDDTDANAILRQARAALRPGGALCLLELVLRDDTPDGGLCDLHLLAGTGGRERTAQMWRALLAASGLRLVTMTHDVGVVSLLVAVPA